MVTPVFTSGVTNEIIAEQLINYLEINHQLNPKHFGFRPKHSIQMAICNFTDHLKSILDQVIVLRAVFINLNSHRQGKASLFV